MIIPLRGAAIFKSLAHYYTFHFLFFRCSILLAPIGTLIWMTGKTGMHKVALNAKNIVKWLLTSRNKLINR